MAPSWRGGRLIQCLAALGTVCSALDLIPPTYRGLCIVLPVPTFGDHSGVRKLLLKKLQCLLQSTGDLRIYDQHRVGGFALFIYMIGWMVLGWSRP